MERKVIYSGKIKPGISKSENCIDIINKINSFKIKKEMKEILFLAAMKIFTKEKKNIDLLFHLESFKRNGEVYPQFSSSKYVQKIIDDVCLISIEDFQILVEKLIDFVSTNNVEF